ncbi:hypothetical protein [Halomonas nitroreducens]|uniref:Uncharacterized protein n=1 Tax=Halomonas nitroreducens TaxID=447425 RepID=A0A431V218_9GAMM|nr:hypothetical protein [Halomonas nitroreducens]RTR01977.1 hypothetical protein EKG36_13290 [Halomonas nitroreducens]
MPDREIPRKIFDPYRRVTDDMNWDTHRPIYEAPFLPTENNQDDEKSGDEQEDEATDVIQDHTHLRS